MHLNMRLLFSHTKYEASMLSKLHHSLKTKANQTPRVAELDIVGDFFSC